MHWSLEIPGVREAHPHYDDLDCDEQEEILEQFMDQKLDDDAEIVIIKVRTTGGQELCYCYTLVENFEWRMVGNTMQQHYVGHFKREAPPPERVKVVARDGKCVTYRDVRDALDQLEYCNHSFLEELSHLGGNEWKAYFGS